VSTEETPKQTEPLKAYRGFDDEFEFYSVGSLKFKVTPLSFSKTEKLELLVDEHEKIIKAFKEGKASDTEKNKSVSRIIKEGLKELLSDDDYTKALESIDKPTLFNTFKDIYAFLQVIGSKEELQLLLTQSKQASQTT